MAVARSLVTGACGFIGTHMVEELGAAGHEVVATDLPAAYALDPDDLGGGRYPSVLRRLGVRLVGAAVRDPGQLAAVVDSFDFVFHVASVFNYSPPWSVYAAVNLGGTQNLLDLLAQRAPHLQRFVLWGAGGVYGLPSFQQGPFHEGMPPAPPNDYLRAKWFQEHHTMDFCTARGIPWTILRPTTVYGPRLVYGFAAVLRSAARANPVLAPACRDGHVPLVHVRDVTGAALHLANCPTGTGIFNLNDDSPYTSVDVFRVVAELQGRRFFPIPGLRCAWIKAGARLAAEASSVLTRLRPGMKPLVEGPTVDFLDCDFHYDNSKLKKTGYQLRYPDARPGFRETIDWYREQGLL